MGEHKKQGKTFFVTVDAHMQFAVHRAPSGHFLILSTMTDAKLPGHCVSHKHMQRISWD